MAEGDARGALDGLRVIDLTTRVAGPACTQFIGDNGADVIKIEPPTGDETRHVSQPMYRGAICGHYAGVNRNKRVTVFIHRHQGPAGAEPPRPLQANSEA